MDPSANNPVVQHRRLRLELRRLRQARHLTQKDVALAMEWSASKVIRIESGEVKISPNDLRPLLLHYKVDGIRVEELIEMARVAKKETWTKFRDVYSQAFLEYLSFETAARIIRGYDPLIVPGLLQTEAYARELLANGGFGRLGYATDNEAITSAIERRWLVREERQKIHTRLDPPRMSFVLDEAAIRRPIGGPAVMRDQLEQLLNWQQKPHVTLRLMPFSAGSYRGLGSGFMMLDFLSDDDVLLCIEELDESSIQNDPERTGFFIDVFLALEERALSSTESGQLIVSALNDILYHS